MGTVIIIGAGIFGAAAAVELLERGFDVHLLDPGPIPHPDASSTDISKVLRMDYGADAFYMDLMRTAFDGWDRWNGRWDAPLYHQTGVLMLCRETMAPGGFEYESFRLLQERGLPVERMDASEIRKRFPAWNVDRYADGYFNPRGGWAESGRVVAALVDEFRRSGGRLHSGVRFGRWIEQGDRVLGVLSANGERFLADACILAAGAWTPFLLPELAEVMWPTAQDVFHFRTADLQKFQPPFFPVFTADVSRTGWYGFPAGPDGTIKIANHGAGRRIDPSGERAVLPGSEQKFRDFFRETFPDLAAAPVVSTRVCFYCDTYDGDFWIGRHPVRDGLFVASGGSGHGFKFAPVLGPLVADLVEGKANAALGRFAWRASGALKSEYARFEGD